MQVIFTSHHSGVVNRGVETYVHELANRLSKYHEVTVFQSGPKLPNTNYQIQPYNIITTNSADVIISLGGRFESILLRKLTFIRRQKLIIPGQSGLGFDDKLNLLCFPDRFIALTKFQSEWAQKFNPFVKTDVIPNGVDLNIFKPSKSKPKLPTIGYVAALYPEKRQELLIRAVAKTSANLILVGKGPDESRLTKLCQQLLPNRFQIINAPHTKMPEIYHKFTIFAYPTVPWESFGIAILEALSSNIPVVVTDDPIRREIVGVAGLFASSENLDEQLNLALIKNWGTSPRHQAEKFSWDEITKKYLELFKEI